MKKILIGCGVALVLLAAVLLLVFFVWIRPQMKEVLNKARDNASNASVNATIGAVRTGITLEYANSMLTNDGGIGVYPVELDSQEDGPCTSCFSKVLEGGVQDPGWNKSGKTYTYTDENKGRSFVYDPADGTLTEQE